MTVLWINLVAVYLVSFLARYYARPTNIGPVYTRPNEILIFVAVASLVMVSGLRNGIGDTSAYMWSYQMNRFTWAEMSFNGDFGFNILQLLLQQISRDPQLLIFATALFTNVLIVISLYKYSKIFELSLYIYITSGMFLVTMNGIRQTLAAAIIFAATKFLLNGDWKKYSLVVLFAFTLHNSALVLIPIYFIVRREAWTKTTLLLLSLSVVIVLGFNQFSSALFSVLGDSRYGQYSNASGEGANVMRVVVNAIPLIVAFMGRHKLKSLFPQSDYIVNMAIIGLVFKLISTQQWIFARFSIYFGFYNIILISWVVSLFVEREKKLIYYCILLFYFLYFYYESVISLGLIYRSDYLTW
ncbi:capsular biosynthesis protein [Cohnella kolymensis]|uniref:Capsular biosynthesis protein n=1 Tax=Cohnella kolymensis TaxID=1590652 RepID=A0ABR5A2V9_9BACL|nr:EpsG family protein [Cohnella kolymensis]KIL35398.1 capsular biosynthesis protein [Cohnella kolymensis]